MIIEATVLPEVFVIQPEIFQDQRGFFLESYNKKRFDQAVGRDVCFVQDNHSRSTKGVLRGLHYQLPPRPQGKLVRALAGEIFDVAVDVRRSSDNFGKWTAVHLSAENGRQLWIPEGFAHGFVTLTAAAEVLYKTTDYYEPEAERSIVWNDLDIGIEWPYQGNPVLAFKDANAPLFAAAETFA